MAATKRETRDLDAIMGEAAAEPTRSHGKPAGGGIAELLAKMVTKDEPSRYGPRRGITYRIEPEQIDYLRRKANERRHKLAGGMGRADASEVLRVLLRELMDNDPEPGK